MNRAYGQGLYGQGLYGGLSIVAEFEPANYRVKITVAGLGGGDTFVSVSKSVVSPEGATANQDVRAGFLGPPSIPTSIFYDYELTSGWTHTYHAHTDVRAEVDSDAVVPAFPAGLVLKSPMRPFLNTPVTVQEIGDVTREDRGGLFYVVGRTLPVARTSVRSGRNVNLSVLTSTAQQFEALDALLASGDIVYLDQPEAMPVVLPLYAKVNTYGQARTSRLGATRKLWSLDLTEVTPPDFLVGGVQITWATVVNSFATWADVPLGVNTDTWLELLDNLADASEVIVT